MIYVISKQTGKIAGKFPNVILAREYVVTDLQSDIGLYDFLQDMAENIVSRIVYIDGKCVYNNKKFWTRDLSDLITNYSEHTVFDILGQNISVARFKQEYLSNMNRIGLIDGRPGQIVYNMQVGKEFVSLFREECILTKFTKESDTSPMIIFEKLTPVIAMLDAGAFREAKQYLQGYRAKIKDDFLTDERIDKYIAMLDAADAIEYATEEDYFYTAPETEA